MWDEIVGNSCSCFYMGRNKRDFSFVHFFLWDEIRISSLLLFLCGAKYFICSYIHVGRDQRDFVFVLAFIRDEIRGISRVFLLLCETKQKGEKKNRR